MDPFLSSYDGSDDSGRGLDMGSILTNSESHDESFSSYFGRDLAALKDQILELESSFCHSDITNCSSGDKSFGADHSRSSFDIPEYMLEDKAAECLDDKRRARNLGRSYSHVSDSTNGSATKSRPGLMRKASQRAMSTFKGVAGISTRHLRTGQQKTPLLDGQDENGQEKFEQSSVDRWASETEKAGGRRGLLSRMGSRMAVQDDSKQGTDRDRLVRRPSLNKATSERFGTSFFRSKSREKVTSLEETADYSALGGDISICSAEDGAMQLSLSHLGGETLSSRESSTSSEESRLPPIAQFEVTLPEQDSNRVGLPGEPQATNKIDNTQPSQRMKSDLGRTARRKPKRVSSGNRIERAQLRRASSSNNIEQTSHHSAGVEEDAKQGGRSRRAPRRTFSSTSSGEAVGSKPNLSKVRRSTSSTLAESSSVLEDDGISQHHSRGGEICRQSVKRGEKAIGSSQDHKTSRHSSKAREAETIKCSSENNSSRHDAESASRHSSSRNKVPHHSSRSTETSRHSSRGNDISRHSSRGNDISRHSSRGNDISRHSSRGNDISRHSSRSTERRRHRSSRHKDPSKPKKESKELDDGDEETNPLSDDAIARKAMVALSA